MSKFNVGDKVIEKTSLRAHTNYPVKEVVAYLGDAVLAIGWGDGFGDELHRYDFMDEYGPGSRHWREGIVRLQESELLTPAEALTELRKPEVIKSQLEAEFEGVRSQVQEKMDKAAGLVKEASDLVKPTGKDFYDLTDECEALYRALSGGGWSHSTMRCRFGR